MATNLDLIAPKGAGYRVRLTTFDNRPSRLCITNGRKGETRYVTVSDDDLRGLITALVDHLEEKETRALGPNNAED